MLDPSSWFGSGFLPCPPDVNRHLSGEGLPDDVCGTAAGRDDIVVSRLSSAAESGCVFTSSVKLDTDSLAQVGRHVLCVFQASEIYRNTSKWHYCLVLALSLVPHCCLRGPYDAQTVNLTIAHDSLCDTCVGRPTQQFGSFLVATTPTSFCQDSQDAHVTTTCGRLIGEAEGVSFVMTCWSCRVDIRIVDISSPPVNLPLVLQVSIGSNMLRFCSGAGGLLFGIRAMLGFGEGVVARFGFTRPID